MEEAQLQSEKRDSIALKRNAKGEYAWDLKIYFDSAGNYAEVLERLSIIDIGLRGRFLPTIDANLTSAERERLAELALGYETL